jgi:hypothetical protein
MFYDLVKKNEKKKEITKQVFVSITGSNVKTL